MYGVQSSKSFLVGHHHVEIIGSSSKERNKNSNNISDRTYKQGQSWFDLCLYDLCFIVLCYKGRKDTIVPGGSQFTRYNLSVSLCLKERPKWKIRSDLFCVARYNSSWERVNQPLFVFRPGTEFKSNNIYRVFQKFVPIFCSLKFHWLLKILFVKLSMLFIFI